MAASEAPRFAAEYARAFVPAAQLPSEPSPALAGLIPLFHPGPFRSTSCEVRLTKRTAAQGFAIAGMAVPSGPDGWRVEGNGPREYESHTMSPDLISLIATP
jgi:hypothetical protein